MLRGFSLVRQHGCWLAHARPTINDDPIRPVPPWTRVAPGTANLGTRWKGFRWRGDRRRSRAAGDACTAAIVSEIETWGRSATDCLRWVRSPQPSAPGGRQRERSPCRPAPPRRGDSHPATLAHRLQDGDVVDRLPIPVVCRESLPVRRQTRSKSQRACLQPQPQE